ncbi:MAG TPA: ATP-binding protein [Tenuifilaceae bacterium]|jgi:anti-sigma regulatory factor (Ser/Thr protein kinase)|nr:ATP-binding protein [Bacteroidales bacterium]MDI9517676.1 ATP-binding protein [Bacteroidota bacterium]OQC65201.1 MAG: Non-motile and phage-resistance protein [Bacteroidetes bacterium ADurb.Bin008]HNV81954.1 ATP-binding protein [Tenuifilaceae bacterium]HOF91895.1 ATP-binding protein [Tenuifilaceae bacterium]
MKELALHILDIAQNSIVAGATLIRIGITEDMQGDLLHMTVEDNGKGMPSEMVERVMNPYTTSRTTRRVGMGLPLLHDACRAANGMLTIESAVNEGTRVLATMQLSHIDRQPLGDITGVIVLLFSANPSIDFVYSHIRNGNSYIFDTREVKELLEGIPLNTPEVIKSIREMIASNLDEL